MSRFNLSILWLKVTAVGTIIFGFILALFNQSSLFQYLFNGYINHSFWSIDTAPYVAITFQKWIYGLLGSVLIIIGIIIFGLAKHSFSKRERWSRNYILIALIIWAITDSAVSLYYEVYYNLIINAVILLLYLTPIVASWREFKR